MSDFLDENDTHTARLHFDTFTNGLQIPDLTVPGLRLDGLAPQQMLVAAERHSAEHLRRRVTAAITHPVNERGTSTTVIAISDDAGVLIAVSEPEITLDPPGPSTTS